MLETISPSIVDIEASGFGPDSYPIEIGIVKGDGERYCALIQPSPTWTHWSDAAEEIHGISRQTIESQGKPIPQVCMEVNTFLQSDQIYSDAWAHDERWLRKLFGIAQIRPSFELRAIEFIMLENQFKIWDGVKQQVRSRMNIERHRASSDALVIQKTFVESRLAGLQSRHMENSITASR